MKVEVEHEVKLEQMPDDSEVVEFELFGMEVVGEDELANLPEFEDD